MIFHTESSTYEIDTERNRIRRLSGRADPTSGQGQDGVWKDFKSTTDVVQGAQVLIVWTDGSKPTLTSRVRKVIEKEIEKAN